MGKIIPAVPWSGEDLDIMTRTIAGEARGEPLDGQIAVGWVIRTRATWDEVVKHQSAEHEWWGTSIAHACMHKWQFSCWNGGPDTDFIKNMSVHSYLYNYLRNVAIDVLDGNEPDPTFGSTTYKVTGTEASWDWAVAAVEPKIIGHHSFWRLPPAGPVLPFLEG